MSMQRFVSNQKFRKQVRRFLMSGAQAELTKILALQPGMSDVERAQALKSDTNLATTLLNAYPQTRTQAAAEVSASLQIMENLRIAAVAGIARIDRPFANYLGQLRSVMNISSDNTSARPGKTELRAQLDHALVSSKHIRRRSKTFLCSALGMFLLALLLFSIELSLLYQQFELLVEAAGGIDELFDTLAAAGLTLIITFLMMLLTHLGSAPLLRRVWRVLQTDEATGDAAFKIGRSAGVVMGISSILTFMVAYGLGTLREQMVVSDGSGTTFVLINALGLPVLSLFVHLCFQEGYKSWQVYRHRTDQTLQALKNLGTANRDFARAEMQSRKARPIVRELQRLEERHQKALKAAYESALKSPALRAEINRLADILLAPTVGVSADEESADLSSTNH